MNIAFIGWGSLVWRPGGLPVDGQWFFDGPLLPIEFCRQSDDGRLTLVVCSGSAMIHTLWALASNDDLGKVITSLQEREGLRGARRDKNTGVWPDDPRYTKAGSGIVSWAKGKNLDAVVWTALGPRFNAVSRCPTEDEAVDYLRTLEGEKRQRAEEYVRRTPLQINTGYRKRFVAEFGWTPVG